MGDVTLQSTVGFRVKSGWAAAVLLRGPSGSPTVLDSRRVELADPAIPATVQPYHDGFGTAQADSRVVERHIRRIEDCARRNVAALFEEYRAASHWPTRAAVIATSDTDPETITNPHIRIHGLEGRLFRRVVEEALVAGGLEPGVFLERDLLTSAEETLGQSPAALTRRLTALRPTAGGPWRSEQKSAALAAWLLLASAVGGLPARSPAPGRRRHRA